MVLRALCKAFPISVLGFIGVSFKGMQVQIGAASKFLRRIWSQQIQGCCFDRAFCFPKRSGAGNGPRYKCMLRQLYFVPLRKPISTQSGESVAEGTVSLSSSSTAANYNSQSEHIEEEQSFLSCEMMSSAERDLNTVPPTADQQAEVMEENVRDSSSNKDTEVHSVFVEASASLIRLIKGKWGLTLKQIEEETGVKITYSSSKKDDHIVAEGISAESVRKAQEKLASVFEEAVKSPSLDYSHFISLPLAVHPELVHKLQKFQNIILGNDTSGLGNLDNSSNEDNSDTDHAEGSKLKSKTISAKIEVQNEKEQVRQKIDATGANSSASGHPSSILSELGIDKSIFIKPTTFHLTVLMLKLWNQDRVAAAAEVLQNISSQVNDALDNRAVSIRLKGLECMRGSPAKARVVYAPVEEIGREGRLLRACQVIIEAFVKADLVLEKDAQQTLKLHATLMNARHRKRKKKTKRQDSFDARGIFSRFGSENWGDYRIQEVHLSQRFKFDETGYYHCCASIPFPESSAN